MKVNGTTFAQIFQAQCGSYPIGPHHIVDELSTLNAVFVRSIVDREMGTNRHECLQKWYNRVKVPFFIETHLVRA